jgi:transmembrane sensor
VLTTAAVLTVWVLFLLRAEIIETGRGERRDVLLADGSLIQVDPLTVLQVRLKAHRRDIKLEQGRAVFRVARDPDRPFTVQSGMTLVRAVGTQFGVERESKGTVVTVASGKVAIRTSGRQNEASAVHAPEEEPTAAEVVLTAGQQVTVEGSGTAEPVKHVDSDRALAWADGRLEFENTPVAAVVEQFNRYNFVQLHVGDQQLGNRLVHGVFDVSEPESFISVIQTLTPVRIERKGQDITLYSGP